MKQVSNGFWSFDQKDIILFIISALIQVIIIFSMHFDFRNLKFEKQYIRHLVFQDSLISLFTSKTLFKTSLSQKTINTYSPAEPSSIFCDPLSFHSLLLHVLNSAYKKLLLFYYSKISPPDSIQVNRKSTILAQNTLILLTSFFVCYVYKRLLTYFSVCKRTVSPVNEEFDIKLHQNYTTPFLLTIICLILPTQFSYLRCTCTSDSLFFGLLCLSFIFFNISTFLSSFCFVFTFFLAIHTRYEGFLLIFVFFILLIYQITQLFSLKNKQLKYLFCLCIKFVGIVSVTYLYYFRFANYANRPFNWSDFLLHLLYPYSFQDGSNQIHYPFKALIHQALTINTLRQAHTEFALFFPLLFVGIYLLVSTNYKDPHHLKSEEQSKNEKKTIENDHTENSYQRYANSEYRFDITIIFYRQVGICVLIYTIFASCFTCGAVYRMVSFVQALSFPIVLEPLIQRFLAVLLCEKQNKAGLFSIPIEKIVCGLAFGVFGIAVIVWDCLIAKREIIRLTFKSSLWMNLSLN